MPTRRPPRKHVAVQGWRTIGGKEIYARSKMEANAARYLQFLKEQQQIRSWIHEPKTFWFEDIRRGVCSYLPDFLVNPRGDAEPYYVEVKGWMDPKSKTKLKRMAKYYPDVRIEVWDAKRMAGLNRTVGPLIEGWE